MLTLEDGQPVELYDGQRAMLRDYFAGTTETLILVPKKNGKTTLLAALALFHLVTTPDAECVIAAASRDQAQIMLRQARGFIRRSPGLQQRMVVKQREIESRRDEGRIRVLAADADTADGVLPTLALVDELHRHKSSELYGVFRDGLGPRDGRLITISTAADDESSPLGVMRKAAYELPEVRRDGAYRYCRSSDGGYVMHEWALEPDQDRSDMRVVKEANPAPWQTVEALRRRHDSPSMTSWQWARFACGVWLQGEDSAINPVEWAARGKRGREIPGGADVSLGIDLGWKWDTTAVVPLARVEEAWRYDRPAVLVPPRDGTSLPVDAVMDRVLEFAERWQVRRVVLDPNADGEHLAARIENELPDVDVVAHSQRPEPMALAAQRFAAAIRDGSLEHPADDVFTAHVLAAVAKRVPGTDKWRFAKKRKAIDALIAAAMVLSVELAERQASAYEDRELLIL